MNESETLGKYKKWSRVQTQLVRVKQCLSAIIESEALGKYKQ